MNLSFLSLLYIPSTAKYCLFSSTVHFKHTSAAILSSQVHSQGWCCHRDSQLCLETELDVTTGGEDTAVLQWVDARDAYKHPIRQPPTKNFLAPNAIC